MDPRSVISTSGHPTSFNSPKSRMLRKSLEFMDFRAGKRRGRRVKRSMKTTAQSLPEAICFFPDAYSGLSSTSNHSPAAPRGRQQVAHVGLPLLEAVTGGQDATGECSGGGEGEKAGGAPSMRLTGAGSDGVPNVV
eukprot:scaffold8777_cov130-Isochrysis_galbana.AAC.3